MKWTEVKKIEVEFWKCDFCDTKSNEGNRGCCGVRPIETCRICGKHACRLHREYFTEEPWADYPYGFYACEDCREEAQSAWDDAVEEAGRHEDILDVVKDCIDRTRFQKNFDRGIKHVPFEWHKRI